MKHRILIVEDDREISRMTEEELKREGFEAVPAYDGEEALALFRHDPFDLVLLDLMLPGVDGMEVLKELRTGSRIPVLILSAKDSDLDKALGLGFGADDYISKPFSMIELMARVKAAIRRSEVYSKHSEEPSVLSAGDIMLDLNNYTVLRNGTALNLTSKEFEILKLLISNPGRVFTKAQLYAFVWGEEYMGDENVINVHMRRLRTKVETDPSKPQVIKTIWGIGYKLGDV